MDCLQLKLEAIDKTKELFDSGLILHLLQNKTHDEYRDLHEQRDSKTRLRAEEVRQSDPRRGAEDGPGEAHVHPVAGEDRDRDKDQLRELLVLGGLGHRLIDVSKHRYDGDKMNNAKNDPFCAGFHEVVPYANSVEACARVASRFALNVGLCARFVVASALSAGRIARFAGRIAQFAYQFERISGVVAKSRLDIARLFHQTKPVPNAQPQTNRLIFCQWATVSDRTTQGIQV